MNIIKCPFCGEILKKGNHHHKCEEKIKFLNEKLFDELKQKYVDEEYSIKDLGLYFNEKYKEHLFSKIPDSFFRKIVKEKLNSYYRNLKDSTRTKKSRDKYKETMLDKYGYSHNFNKGCESRLKWEKRLLEEEGITNVFQRESVKEKITESLLKKYGSIDNIKKMRGYFSTKDGFKEKYGDNWKYEWDILIDSKRTACEDFYKRKYGDDWESYWKKHLEKVKHRMLNNNYNGLNIKCYKILEKNGISFEKEFALEKPLDYQTYYGKGYFFYYDIKIDNLLIELNGTYWHCDPRVYKESDIVKFPKNTMKRVCDVWEKDLVKMKNAIDKGYYFETIWEKDFSEEKIIEILKKYNLWNK